MSWLRCWTEAEPTGEATLALLLAAGDSEELVGEQVEGGCTTIRVGFKAAQDESFGLQRHGLRYLRVDLKHSHLQMRSADRVLTGSGGGAELRRCMQIGSDKLCAIGANHLIVCGSTVSKGKPVFIKWTAGKVAWCSTWEQECSKVVGKTRTITPEAPCCCLGMLT